MALYKFRIIIIIIIIIMHDLLGAANGVSPKVFSSFLSNCLGFQSIILPTFIHRIMRITILSVAFSVFKYQHCSYAI